MTKLATQLSVTSQVYDFDITSIGWVTKEVYHIHTLGHQQRRNKSKNGELTKDRINDEENSERWSLNGIANEASFAYHGARILGKNQREVIDAWVASHTIDSPDVGRDIPAGVLFEKPVENKYTDYDVMNLGPSKGLLYMRTGNGYMAEFPSMSRSFGPYYRGDDQPEIEYWEDYLPDSVYALSQLQPKKGRFFFQFVKWVEKECFLREYKFQGSRQHCYRNTLGYKGYPIIAVHHSRCNDPNELF